MSASSNKKKSHPVAIVERLHAADCTALTAVRNGTWGTPWAAIHPKNQEAMVWRGVLGRKGHGYTMWLRFICNCTGCPATVLIKAEAICHLAPIGSAAKAVRKEAR